MFLMNLMFYSYKMNPIMILLLNMYLGINLLLMFFSICFNQWVFIFISMLYSGGMMVMFSFCICMIGKTKTFKIYKLMFFLYFFFIFLINKNFNKISDLNFSMKENFFSMIVMFMLIIFLSFLITFSMKDKKCFKSLN